MTWQAGETYRAGNAGYGERVPKRVDHEERRRQIADALLRTAEGP